MGVGKFWVRVCLGGDLLSTSTCGYGFGASDSALMLTMCALQMFALLFNIL